MNLRGVVDLIIGESPDCYLAAYRNNLACRLKFSSALGKVHDAKDREIAALNSKLKKLEKELAIVNGLVELQKKVQAMFSAMQRDDAP